MGGFVSQIASERETERLIECIGKRAANLFLTRQLWCSGAVLVTLNQALGGALSQRMAIQLCAGLGDGLGGSGCLCGALSGATLALGLFLGNGRLAPGGDQRVLKFTNTLHRQFKAHYGSTCCRVLTKSLPMGTAVQMTACAERTACAAKMAARQILNTIPQLAESADWDFLNQSDSPLRARLKVVANTFQKC